MSKNDYQDLLQAISASALRANGAAATGAIPAKEIKEMRDCLVSLERMAQKDTEQAAANSLRALAASADVVFYSEPPKLKPVTDQGEPMAAGELSAIYADSTDALYFLTYQHPFWLPFVTAGFKGSALYACQIERHALGQSLAPSVPIENDTAVLVFRSRQGMFEFMQSPEFQRL